MLSFHSYRCMRYCESKNYKFDYIFIDAPYLRNRKAGDLYGEILHELNKFEILKENGIIIIQHLSRVRFNSNIGDYVYSGTKKYAKNSLSIFKNEKT